MAGGFVLLLAGGLQACCFQTSGTDTNESMATTSDAAPVGALGIVDWGPRETRVGIPFNVQEGGRAAIWIRVNRTLAGQSALIQFDDAFLEGNASGDLVMAVVPEASYAKPGVYEVRVIASAGDVHRSSDKVSFTVE